MVASVGLLSHSRTSIEECPAITAGVSGWVRSRASSSSNFEVLQGARCVSATRRALIGASQPRSRRILATR